MADSEEQPQQVPDDQPEVTDQQDASQDVAVAVPQTEASAETAQSEPAQSEPADQQEGEKDDGKEQSGEGDDAKKEDEVITISHEDSPHWLSAEECAAKGISQEAMSSFQHTYFQHAYTIKTWYEALSEHTFTTEFIKLSEDEVDSLIAACHPGQPDQPELSDVQREILEQIEKKLNDAIEKFEGDGGFIRVNDRNPTDAILERNDAEFVAKIRDAVINELEVFKQSANAYVIWNEQGRQDGTFRRTMSRLRQSFRRQRAPSTSSSSAKKEQTVKLEDTTGQGEEDKKTEDDATTEETKEEAGGDEEKDGGGEGEGDKKVEDTSVTVEAEVQDSGDNTAEQEEGQKPPEEEGQKPPEEPEQVEKESKSKEEAAKTEDGEDEIEKAPEQDEEAPETPKAKREDLPPVRKIKSESLDNEVLRAFGRAMPTMYRVATGKEALDMLLRSGLTKQYLTELKQYGEVEGLSATISVTRFHADIARYPGMVLRCFVYEGELTALSQKHDNVTYFPNVAQYKNIIQYKVKQFHEECVKEVLTEKSYIIDVFISAEKIYILRLSPFYTGTGACLFTWAENAKQVTCQPPIDFKLIEAPPKAPELYSGLQSQWSSMLESVLQQKQNENRPQGIKSCTIL